MVKASAISTLIVSLFLLFSTPLFANNYQGKLELITADELLNNSEQYLVLDTRSKSEFDQGHIQGALNIPHTEVINQLEKLKGVNKTIVVHCRSGRRALTAEQALLDNGFNNLKHLQGDIKGWTANGYPLVTAEH
ncbi:MAG: rhodanese-like domain-containing protein [Gammaproteobacteria bacterium]|nr:rhodanese-like domain-containing protein [Gammaproteobacteria bacterium]